MKIILDNLKIFVLISSNFDCIFLENAISIFFYPEVDSESLSTLQNIKFKREASRVEGYVTQTHTVTHTQTNTQTHKHTHMQMHSDTRMHAYTHACMPNHLPPQTTPRVLRGREGVGRRGEEGGDEEG
jgi:hypothetical protein